jgi:hypothetical protein
MVTGWCRGGGFLPVASYFLNAKIQIAAVPHFFSIREMKFRIEKYMS